MGNTHVHIAVSRGNYVAVEILKAHGADLNVKNDFDQTPYHMAYANNDIKMIELLKKLGADVPEDFTT